jgi:hypothetical protein
MARSGHRVIARDLAPTSQQRARRGPVIGRSVLCGIRGIRRCRKSRKGQLPEIFLQHLAHGVVYVLPRCSGMLFTSLMKIWEYQKERGKHWSL